MANSYTGLFQTLAAAFNEASLAKSARNALLEYCTTDFAPEIAAPYSVINTNIANSTGAVTNLASGASQTLADVNLDPGAVTLNRHPTYGFALPSVDLAKGPSQSLVAKLRDEAIKKIGNDCNAALAALVTPTAFDVHTKVTSATADTVDDAAMQDAWTTLANADVPVGDVGNLFLVLNPAVYATLVNTAKWSQAAYVGNELAGRVRSTAFLGRQWGAVCDWDPDLALAGGKYPGLLFHRYAIALAARALAPPMNPNIPCTYVSYKGIPIRVTIDFNNKTMSDEIVFDALMGAAVVRPDHGLYVEVTKST